MPCSAPARGVAVGAIPPFNDQTDNNPCGQTEVASLGGEDVSAHALCLFHLGQKLGLAAIKRPIIFGGA